MGLNRLILLRSGDELAVYCVQSWRAINIGRNDAARTYVLHAINRGANAGDDFACNTSSRSYRRRTGLDGATIDRSERVHTEQMEFIDLYEQQIRRWRTENPSVAQNSELDRIEKENRELRTATADVLALAPELRKDSIDRILEMSDLEIGLQTLLGTPSSARR